MNKTIHKKILVGCLAVGFAILLMIAPGKANAAQAHPPGSLVKVGSTVWRISDDGSKKYSIESQEKFLSHRFSFTNVVSANAADSALPDAGRLPWGDGVLFDYNNVIYQVSGGKRHGFVSADIFLGQGFNFGMVKKGNLAGLAEGTTIRRSTERHLAGTFVADGSGAIWLQEADQARPFPSASVFFSHGGLFSEVVRMNQEDDNHSSVVMNYRPGSLINDNGAIWVVSLKNKLGFPSAPCFLGFGFNFGMAIAGSTSSLPAGPSICSDDAPTPSSGPTSSYSVQSIATSSGTFQARVATFNLASGKIRVLTDSATDSDCRDDCSVASLGAFIKANAAQSGMNGTYFCPQDYSACASETNAFFWKIIDTKTGKMVNTSNGLGEQDPFLAFDAAGRATYFAKWAEFNNSHYSATAGINSPGIIENGRISLNYSKLDDKQRTVKSIRGAVGLKGQNLYLIHVLNATIPDVALVLQNMGLDYALGLDGGGSSALMYQNSYKTSPGRNIPNAILVEELP